MFELATTGSPYIGVTTNRRVTLSRQLGYVVVDDRVTGATSRVYRQLWHLKEGSDPKVNGAMIWTRRSRGNILIYQLLGSPLSKVITGSTYPVQGWLTYDFNQKIAAPVVEARLTGSSVRFLTLLVPYATTRPAVKVTALTLTANGYALTVSVEGHSEHLVMDSKQSSVTPLN
jgi:hypothetical protein